MRGEKFVRHGIGLRGLTGGRSAWGMHRVLHRVLHHFPCSAAFTRRGRLLQPEFEVGPRAAACKPANNCPVLPIV